MTPLSLTDMAAIRQIIRDGKADQRLALALCDEIDRQSDMIAKLVALNMRADRILKTVGQRLAAMIDTKALR